MLTATLDRLQGLLSRQFVIAYALPSLFFAILSLALYELVLAERVGPEGWSVLAWYGALDGVLQTIVGLLGMVIFVTLTFVLALLVPLWRRFLEGRALPEWIKAPLRAGHRDRLWQLKERRRRLKLMDTTLKHAGKQLATSIAAARGAAPPAPAAQLNKAGAGMLLERAQEALRQTWAEYDIEQAVADKLPAAIEAVGQAVTANLNLCKSDTEILIDRLNATKEYLDNRRAAQDIALAKEEARQFPIDLLAPTHLGNVADAIRSQISHVYGLDTDYFWLRLEAVLPKDEPLKEEVMDGKAKLDAMLLLCFYSGLFTLIWLFLTWVYGASAWLFLAVGLFGPAAMIGFYHLAVESYLALGDSMRSAVDLYRFDLLKALKIKLPADRTREKKDWEKLHRALVYGEPINLPYEHT